MSERLGWKAYCKQVYLVFCDRYAHWFFLVGVLLLIFSRFFTFAYNFSYSLPHKLYLVAKWQTSLSAFQTGDYVAFKWDGPYYAKGTQFLKRMAGKPGDMVMRKGREFRINGESVGKAKTHARNGDILEINPFTGAIPDAYVWVAGEHADSLDSRYAIAGLVHQSQLIGKAYPIF